MGSFQIPLDPSMSLESVAHYLPVPPKYDDGGAHVGRIPTPEIFKKAAKSPFVKREMDNMDEIFPDLPSVSHNSASEGTSTRVYANILHRKLQRRRKQT